jgi:hypothetical protein
MTNEVETCHCSALALTVLHQLDAASQAELILDDILQMIDKTVFRANLLLDCGACLKNLTAQATLVTMAARLSEIISRYDKGLQALRRAKHEKEPSRQASLGGYVLEEADSELLETELVRTRLEEIRRIMRVAKDAIDMSQRPSEAMLDGTRKEALGVMMALLYESLDHVQTSISTRQSSIQ